jgi:hypothetical protein
VTKPRYRLYRGDLKAQKTVEPAFGKQRARAEVSRILPFCFRNAGLEFKA